MSKSFYIELIFAVYKVTELFPTGQALKDEIRKLADEILVSLLCNNHKGCSENIKIIQNLFNLAENRGLVDPRNFLVLRREYAKIGDLCANNVNNVGKTVSCLPADRENSSTNGKNRKRQEVILGILKNNNKVKISDLAKSFPNINRRTLLRDLGGFCQTGLAEKNGNGRGVCYTIRNATL